MNIAIKRRLRLVLSFLLLLPFALGYLLGLESLPVFIVTVITSLAVLSSGYLLGLGTDSLRFIVSQTLALAVLAVIQTLPEYAVEGVLSYKAAFNSELLHYVTANLTGANRLLIGFGWPFAFLVSYLAGGRKENSISMDKDQAVEVFFLGISTLYSFIIYLKGSLTILDGIILTFIFLSYLAIAIKLPPGAYVEEEVILSRPLVVFFLVVGCGTIFLSAEPFVSSVLQTGIMLGINDYILIQWLAPVVSEAPEIVTVVYWAAKSGMCKTAISNLISSKINQWTLLFALIPFVYLLASGNSMIKLTPMQKEEIFLTAAQSLFGFVCLTDMRLSIFESSSLFSLFFVQLLLPETRLAISFLYLSLCAVRIATEKERSKVFVSFSNVFREHFLRTHQQQ